RVVRAVRQELEREEGVRGAALAEVDLDRVGLPGPAAVAGDDEVEGEAAEDALLREPAPDLRGLAADERRGGLVRGEPAPEVGLPRLAAEHLVVRREQLHLAERRHAELDARAPDLARLDPLLDDALLLRELLEEARVGERGHLEAHVREERAH